MSAPVVSVIVVAHNSGALLRESVAAVLAQDAMLELLVVDNASDDASIEQLPHDLRLQLIRNSNNAGFGTACNQGAACARGTMLLFLNPDCLLPSGALQRLLYLMAEETNIGLLGAQLLDADGTPQAASRRRTPRPDLALRAALGIGGGLAEKCPMTVSEATDAVDDVDAISGALMLIRRDFFNQIGGFDDRYVLHCEDLDLCRRVLMAGHRVVIAPQVSVMHYKGTSSRRRPIWVEWQKHRGMLRYFRKFDAGTSPWWLRVLVPLGVWARFPLAAARAWRRAHRTG